VRLEKQDLGRGARVARAEETGAHDAGRIDDEEITRVDKRRQIAEVMVHNRPAGPIDDHQATGVAGFHRGLGDPVRR
jgi:hypothetical protein